MKLRTVFYNCFSMNLKRDSPFTAEHKEIAYFAYFYYTLYVFFGSSRCFYDSVLDNSNVHAMRNYVFMEVL